jgi:hypothetical protein
MKLMILVMMVQYFHYQLILLVLSMLYQILSKSKLLRHFHYLVLHHMLMYYHHKIMIPNKISLFKYEIFYLLKILDKELIQYNLMQLILILVEHIQKLKVIKQKSILLLYMNYLLFH